MAEQDVNVTSGTDTDDRSDKLKSKNDGSAAGGTDSDEALDWKMFTASIPTDALIALSLMPVAVNLCTDTISC